MIPIVFQYNKRDLPDTVDLKIMERSLNARGTASWPSVATEGKGVLEAFAAGLERTMKELATRYKIGENISDARSAKDWTEKTIQETFGVSLEQLKKEEVAQPTSGFPAPSKVVRVKTPTVGSTRSSPPPPSSADIAPPPSLTDVGPPLSSPNLAPPPSLSSSQIDTSPGVSSPSVASTVEPPTASEQPPPLPTAADEFADPRAAQAMVESYAEAASGLADHISEIREQSEVANKRVTTFSKVVDLAKQLFGAPAEQIPRVLGNIVEALAVGLSCSQASLALIRPDGHLEQVSGLGLVVDPLEGAKTPGGRPLARAIVDGGKTMVQIRGETGPLGDAIDRAGVDCVAVVAVPLKTPVHSVGLLSFYLAQEAPIPNQAAIQHLERVLLELTMAIEVISDATGSAALKQSLKAAFRGQVAEGAMQNTDVALSGIEGTLGRIRARTDAPAWLAQEMQQLDTCLASLKFVRQLVIGLRRGQLPSRTSTAVPEILARMEQELGPSLAEEGIRFLIEVKPGVRPVNAEPFLLRGALGSLVDDSRRRLTGLSDGVIRIVTQPDTNGVRVSVFDNLTPSPPSTAVPPAIFSGLSSGGFPMSRPRSYAASSSTSRVSGRSRPARASAPSGRSFFRRRSGRSDSVASPRLGVRVARVEVKACQFHAPSSSINSWNMDSSGRSR